MSDPSAPFVAALRKLNIPLVGYQTHPTFQSLPSTVADPLWDDFKKPPYSLAVFELRAIKKVCCPTTPVPPAEALASGPQINVLPSELSKTRMYSWMCRPVVAKYDFLGHAGLSLLMEKIRSTPSCRMSDNQEFLSLQMCAQSGLHWPSEADPSITEDDLFALLRYVENRCTKRQQLQVRRLMLSEAEGFCNRFASRTSKSDLVMTARLAYGALLGVIGGAAKGELDAMGCALPSAIQISCDFLYHAVHMQQLSVEDVAIPFMVVAGGDVQFGAVYSLEHEFYPVPVLLTPPMSRYDLSAVYPVLEGLVDYVDNYLMALPVEPRCRPLRHRLLRLHPWYYFLKPLQLFFHPYGFAHHRLHRLLAMFDALFGCEALRSIVVFPVGFIGFPDHRNRLVRDFLGEEMIAGLDEAIDQQLIERARVAPFEESVVRLQRKRKVSSGEYKPSKRPRNESDNKYDGSRASASDRERHSDSDSDSDNDSDRTPSEFDDVDDIDEGRPPLPSGYPIVVYPRLDETWQLAGTTDIALGESVVYVPETHRREFFAKVCEAVHLMANNAGVCHLDIRLSNIFFRIHRPSAIANDDRDERGDVQIKIIDFDFAHPQDHVLPDEFAMLIRETVNAYPPHIDVANDAWQQYMLNALRDALGLDSTEA